jgi:FkbM family methyltransferase
MQLSYAQNLEDYHLDLVLGDKAAGTYVDVGGGHPVADNVSFWFYLKGWRGLVVEPQQALAEIYAHVRPRDHTVCCLAGRADGEMDFHVVDTLHGLSSTLRERAAGAGDFGAGFRTITRPVRTLSRLLEEASLGAIDFLKIDVEGAEADVLAGLDLERFRPRVVVIEAVVPGDMAEAWGAWEPDLLARGYRFALFDRLNRFYVAEEAAELSARFPAEPAPWDRVRHLWDYGRAPERPDHPDHALAKVLQAGLFAALPSLDPALLRSLIERGSHGVRPSGNREPRLAGGAIGSDPLTPDPISPDPVALLGAAEFPRAEEPAADLEALMQTDRFRAALGRIASMYDGGHLLE